MVMGRVFLAALPIGALWGALWSLVVGIVYILVSGHVIRPELGSAALGGVIAAAVLAITPPARRKPLGLLIAAVPLLILLWLRPIAGGDQSGDALPLWHVLSLVVFVSALTVVSLHLCLLGLRGSDGSRYQLEVLLIRVLKGLGFVFFTALVVIPFYVMVMTSLKSQQALLANPLDFSVDLSQGMDRLFRSYVELFTKYRFGTFLVNSALVSAGTVLITLLFAIPGAYAVARLRFPGQAVLSQSILLIYMVPAIVLVIPLYAVFSQLGLRNTLTGLLIVYPATTIPVALYMLQGYFRGLPAELEEAGLMDGLSRLGVIAKITMPLSMPALASVSLYVFMIAWNEFLFAFMFLDDIDIFTLSRGVVSLNSSEVPRQHLMAGAVVATVPILVLFLWFERFLVAGLTAGSVKG